MLGRAAIVWMCIVPVAIANGALRDVLLAPRLGDPTARAISCVTLALAVFFIASISIAWIAPATRRAAWRVGILWLGLTLAFEFVVGHYIFGTPWGELWQDYDVVEGHLWVLVPGTALIAPPIVFRQISLRARRLVAASAVTMLALLSLSSTSSMPVTAPLTGEVDTRLEAATTVLRRVADGRSAAIPLAVLLKAHGIAVFPQSARTGDRYLGTGFMSARGAVPTAWTPPAALSFEGVIPLDLENPSADFILIARTRRGLDSLAQPRFANPLAPPMAPGPLAADAHERIDADLVAYMQFGDYFTGVTIGAWSIRELTPENAKLYGRPYSTEDILGGAGFFHLPPAARAWREALVACFKDWS